MQMKLSSYSANPLSPEIRSTPELDIVCTFPTDSGIFKGPYSVLPLNFLISFAS